MTRRELTRSGEDVESQSRHADSIGNNNSSQPASTLPTYEDAVGMTPAFASAESKSRDGGKSREGRQSSAASWTDADVPQREQAQSIATVPSRDRIGSRSQKGGLNIRGAIWRLFFILGIVVLFNLVARSLFLRSDMGGRTPPPSEPVSDGSSWPSPREIRVHQMTNAIHGTYPLYDLLDLSTLTGAIHVTIEPKSGNKTAVVRIKSTTGAIHIRFAKSASGNVESGKANEKGIFERAYNTQVETTTGQINADILHGGEGGETVLTTKTGLLNLRVTPIGDQASRIETSTMTGLNKVIVEAPMQGTTLKNLTALHRTRISGMLDVLYPQQWEGRVHAWCKGTGSVDVQGEGLNFQGSGTDVYAWRGEDASRNGKIIDVVSEGTGMVKFRG